MSDRPTERERCVAEAVREACIAAALAGFEEAGFSGLCLEGRWECAVSAMRMIDLEALLADLDPS